MSQPVLYVALSHHGFGHATRAGSVLGALRTLVPDVRLIVRSTAPRWLLDAYIDGDFDLRPVALDVGVVQADSLTINRAATLHRLHALMDRQHELVADELRVIRRAGVGLVLSDIPPLAAVVAAEAHVPCWMMGNFGWDWIYRAWGGPFVEVADWIASCHHLCARLFRLPFHEPMASFSNITDVGLTGGTPRHAAGKVRRELKLTAGRERTILLAFGGLGLTRLPYHNLNRHPGRQFITFDDGAPDMPNLVRVSDRGYRSVDVMPVCGRVVGKPGYSTFSEATRLSLPIATIPRSGFAESAILLRGLSRHAHHQILTEDEFFDGDWGFLDAEPRPPEQSQPLPADGTESIAREIARVLA